MHVYTSLLHNACNVHCWKAAHEEMQLQYKAYLEVVHTKINSKFCGITTKVESFDIVLCSQKLTRRVISKSTYIARIIFMFQDWNIYPHLKKERLHNLANSRSRSPKPSSRLLIQLEHLDPND